MRVKGREVHLRLYSKRKVGYVTLYMLEPTITSPYLIVDFEVQLSTSTMTNADECFPNYSKTEKTNRKKRVTERGSAEVGAADVIS
jgi:hypothetical protein